MSIDRRKILGLFAAAGGASALAGCGGGGYDTPTQFVWVLNLNPAFPSLDLSFDAAVVASALQFQALTPAIEVSYGVYTLGLRDRASDRTLYFDNYRVDDHSPSVLVFYRHGTSARLGASPLGIVSYFDSSESLRVELDDGSGSVQTTVLAFEGSAAQASNSTHCRLRLRRTSDDVLVYDSGSRRRTDAILVFPADPVLGLVGVVGLTYGFDDVSAQSWPNIL